MFSSGQHSCGQVFKEEDFFRYLSRPIPDPRDEWISGRLMEWKKFELEEKQSASEATTQVQNDILLVYSERMACLAVRKKDRRFITLGLIALGVDEWRHDYRESLMALTLHFDASSRIGTTPESTFNEVRPMLLPNAAKGLKDFLERPPQSQTLQCMGYTTCNKDDGFRYKRTW